MTSINYNQTIVDCPSLGLQDVPLRTVERMVQHTWQTRESISFVLHCDLDGRLTVIDSVPTA